MSGGFGHLACAVGCHPAELLLVEFDEHAGREEVALPEQIEVIALGFGAEGVSGTDQAGQADGEAGGVAGLEVGVHACQFDRQLLDGRQFVVLADSGHRVPQTADEERSRWYVLGSCCRRCREREAGGCRSRESKEFSSPHWGVALLPLISSQPRGGKAWVGETRGDRVSVSGLCRGRSRGESELLGRNVEHISEASEDVDVGQQGEAPLVPGDLGGGVTGPVT
ncbi:hypothetical protein ACGFN1_22690 [Streptomyces sp. NPDC048685]|uniref:hypothetical protein n=1 Tax=Streptomyces sp. NPDC048685 TaxID=3365584 RepID=UPI0037173D81